MKQIENIIFAFVSLPLHFTLTLYITFYNDTTLLKCYILLSSLTKTNIVREWLNKSLGIFVDSLHPSGFNKVLNYLYFYLMLLKILFSYIYTYTYTYDLMRLSVFQHMLCWVLDQSLLLGALSNCDLVLIKILGCRPRIQRTTLIVIITITITRWTSLR